jgi:glycerol-3-phosphate dehydrogenase
LIARIGVALYDLLAGSTSLGRGKSLTPEAIRSILPQLDDGGLDGGVLFSDRQTEDARLTLAVARDAARHGAELRLGVAVEEILIESGRVAGIRCRSRETGEVVELRARLVVNACGPWADRVRAFAGETAPALRPTRGTHLVLPDLGLARAVMLTGRRPGHRLFAIPWRGATLFGTTDDDDASDPDEIRPQVQDVRLLLDEATRHFPGAGLGVGQVLSTFAGLRTLVRSEGDTLSLSRDHRILDDRGMLTLAGGKLTTWRSMAEDVVNRAATLLGRGGAPRGFSARTRLPGGEETLTADDPRLAPLEDETRAHVLRFYGSEATRITALAREDPDAAQPILPGGLDLLAQVDFAIREEIALRVEDVLLRRLPFGHLPERVRAAGPVVASRMRRLLGWTPERETREIRSLDRRLEEQEQWREGVKS